MNKPEQLSSGAMAPVGQMLSVYRHHLGNSINALQVLVDNLSHWEEANIRTYLERLAVIADEQGALLQALKAYALDSGPTESLSTDRIWKQLSELVHEVIRKGEVAIDLGPPPPTTVVSANLQTLASIWHHLIENACEAMTWVSAPCLKIRAALEGDYVRFSFADNGIGLSEADLV